MTHFEQQVRDELERLKRAGTAGAAEALATFDREVVSEHFRLGRTVGACVVSLLVP